MQTVRQTGTCGYTYIREVDKSAGRQADMWKALSRRTGVTRTGREADRNRRYTCRQGGDSRAGVTGAGREADRYRRVHVQQKGSQTGRQTGSYVEGVNGQV